MSTSEKSRCGSLSTCIKLRVREKSSRNGKQHSYIVLCKQRILEIMNGNAWSIIHKWE